MLRIIVDHGSEWTSLGVEGSLSQPWAEELKKCWQEVAASSQHLRLVVDLTSLTNVDGEGKQILSEMYRSGVKLAGSGVMTRALIEEVMRTA